jgi:hypothetical protein
MVILCKRCRCTHKETNKTSFAFFSDFSVILYDFFKDLVKAHKRLKNLIAYRPSARICFHRCTISFTHKPLEEVEGLQCGPWGRLAVRLAGIRRGRQWRRPREGWSATRSSPWVCWWPELRLGRRQQGGTTVQRLSSRWSSAPVKGAALVEQQMAHEG